MERFSLMRVPPTSTTSGCFLCASSSATAMPLVKMWQGLSGSSLARYSAVVPPSKNRLTPSSMSDTAFLAMTFFASVLVVDFCAYASPERFCTSNTDIAPPRMRMTLFSFSSSRRSRRRVMSETSGNCTANSSRLIFPFFSIKRAISSILVRFVKFILLSVLYTKSITYFTNLGNDFFIICAKITLFSKNFFEARKCRKKY